MTKPTQKVTTVRLPKHLLQKLQRVSKSTGQSVSELIREAIEKEDQGAPPENPWIQEMGALRKDSKQDMEALKTQMERIERNTTKTVSLIEDRLQKLQELNFQILALQTNANETFVASISEIEWMTYALTMAPEDPRTQSRLTTNYGARRDKTSQRFKKLTDRIEDIRKQHSKK
jgi:metal-responsive CopG/Arc/MetJ family transcriptional regulator